jgi:OOP family OmpA-OmpF porin
MKKRTVSIILLAAISAMASAQASEFEGGFVGARIGGNRSNISGSPLSGTTGIDWKSTTTYGIEGGYNWDVQKFLLGVDAFADFNSNADHTASPSSINYGSNAYGLDLKLGLPKGSWLPYARLGYANTNGSGGSSAISGGDLHGGLGIEYKYTPDWGVNAEWSGSSTKSNGSKLNNNNFTVGLRYYFGAPEAVPVHAAEPVAAKEAKMAASTPAPAAETHPMESWKSILTEKPVCLEGANFATNSAKLLKAADVKLNEVVNAAKQYPEVKLEVSGHTDSRGKKVLNQKLSENRAAAVKAWLVKHGVAANRISTAGYADTKPIADNKTKAGRAANRRVEVCYAIKEEKKVRVTE